MKKALALAVLLLTVVIAGCGPKWTVVKQASPNPMTASSSFKVEKAVLDPNFRIGEKTEAEWMGKKDGEAQAKWEGDKTAIYEKFVEGFMSEKENLVVANAPGAGVFSVRARYVQYEPGYYAVVSAAPTQLDADIEYLDAGGQFVDVIRVHVRNSDYSSGGGARKCATEIGQLAAKYLKKRVGGS